jgi:hypothetical protein
MMGRYNNFEEMAPVKSTRLRLVTSRLRSRNTLLFPFLWPCKVLGQPKADCSRSEKASVLLVDAEAGDTGRLGLIVGGSSIPSKISLKRCSGVRGIEFFHTMRAKRRCHQGVSCHVLRPRPSPDNPSDPSLSHKDRIGTEDGPIWGWSGVAVCAFAWFTDMYPTSTVLASLPVRHSHVVPRHTTNSTC